MERDAGFVKIVAAVEQRGSDPFGRPAEFAIRMIPVRINDRKRFKSLRCKGQGVKEGHKE